VTAPRRAPDATPPEETLDIRLVTPDRLDDLAGLFDQPGDPKWCWCASFHIAGSVKARPRDENRAVLTERTLQGPSPGLLGYRDGRVIGWVSVAPRASYRKLARSDFAPAGDPDGADPSAAWSIVCFVVDRKERGRGLARRLLDAAVAHAREGGARTIEAYAIDPGAERIPTPIAYGGTIAMFLDAGFHVVGQRLAGATRWPRPIVRLDL
jgi:GNAT superfamily N-acetyltransferase